MVMVITWLDFGGIMLEIIFWQIFFENLGCVFSRSNTLLDIYQEWLVRMMWNEKEVHWLDTGWTMWPWHLTSPRTWTFDFSSSNFKITVSEELLSDWCETKRPWPCSFKVKDWNSLILGMGVGALIDTEEKGCESIIHDHDCDLWVTLVGWVNVQYSHWGDFRHRRAVDKSSYVIF